MTILALFVFKHLPLPKFGSQLLDHMKFSIETSQIMIFFLFIYLSAAKKKGNSYPFSCCTVGSCKMSVSGPILLNDTEFDHET